MNQINIQELYKEKVLKIWGKFKDHDIFSKEEFEYRRHPLLPRTVNTDCLMFIGINPSFKKGTIIPKHEKDIGFYEISKDYNLKDIAYFKKMKDIAKYCKTDWAHLDLFFIRETKQKLIEKLSYSDSGRSFLEAQLTISFDIIEKARPKLIIVSNALAAEFFGKMRSQHQGFDKIWKGFNLFFEDNNIWQQKSTFNSKIGTYEIPLNGKMIPIIFSGMLSGQRALDIGSFERLKWQAKMILETYKY